MSQAHILKINNKVAFDKIKYVLQNWQLSANHWYFLKIDVTMSARLFAQLLVQAKIKENIKALRHWPCKGNPPGTG